MKLLSNIATLFAVSLGTVTAAIAPSYGVNFAEQKVNQGDFIAVAVPYNYKQYRLAIIEQIPGQQKCWQESGYSPTSVDLKLLNFDHSNSCRKAVDTNGYTLRVNGNDDRVSYLLRLMPINNDIYLVADHRDPNLQDLVIGRTSGVAAAPLKINLESGWQFTKRVHEGNVLNHIYLSNNSNPQNIATSPTPIPATNQPGVATNPAIPNQQPVAVTNPSNTQAACPTPQPTVTSTAVDTITSLLTPLTAMVFQSYNSLFDQNLTVSNNPTNQSCP